MDEFSDPDPDYRKIEESLLRKRAEIRHRNDDDEEEDDQSSHGSVYVTPPSSMRDESNSKVRATISF